MPSNSSLCIQDCGVGWWFFTDVSGLSAPSSRVMCAVCLDKLYCGVDINASTSLTVSRHSKKLRKDPSFASLQGNFCKGEIFVRIAEKPECLLRFSSHVNSTWQHFEAARSDMERAKQNYIFKVAVIIKYLQRRQLFVGLNETVVAVSPYSQSKPTATPDSAYWISYNDLRDSGSLYRFLIFWILVYIVSTKNTGSWCAPSTFCLSNRH